MKKHTRKQIPMTCKICGHVSPSIPGLVVHLRVAHNLSSKEYYDTYIEPNIEHKCIHCGSNNVKFINIKNGYSTSCASKQCMLKAIKATKLKKYGDENYNNRKQFLKTLEELKIKDPEWLNKINRKVKSTIEKHKKEDKDFWNKRKLKARETKKQRYGNEFYNGIEKREETLLKKYGVTSVFQLEEVKEKIKTTNFKKYGVEYHSQTDSWYKKVKETCLKKYGVTSKSKLPENRAQAKETTKKRYGDENYRNIEQTKITLSKHTPEEKLATINKRKETCIKLYGTQTPLGKSGTTSSISKLSTRILTILNKNQILNFEREFKIVNADGTFKRYDYKIGNCILEVNGDYWHANPKKYNATDILRMHHIDVLALDIWNVDKQKIKLAESKGYKVVVLWEYDMKKMSDENLFLWLLTNVLKFL